MPIPITIPRLGWTMEEGVFAGWMKDDGDVVRPGDRVFRLEGEKATEEVECLDGGILRIPPDGPKVGDRLAVGAVIGHLIQPNESGGPTDTTPIASPRARRLAAELGIDWKSVRGGGRTGRVRAADVAATGGMRTAPTETDRTGSISPLRKAIAARMLESCRTTAPVTLTAVAGAANLVNLREQFKAVAGQAVPSYTDFLLKLAAVALERHPKLTARWEDGGIIPAERIDLGVAVDTDNGLLVPVVRDVPALGLRQVAERTRELIEKARRGRLAASDMQGGCFTVTNLGAFGIDAFTPIINPPECAVLGVGRIDRRPVVVGETVVAREQVTLSLTFDHRIIDGAPAARFLQTLVALIENPGPWLTT